MLPSTAFGLLQSAPVARHKFCTSVREARPDPLTPIPRISVFGRLMGKQK